MRKFKWIDKKEHPDESFLWRVNMGLFIPTVFTVTMAVILIGYQVYQLFH